MMHVAAALMLAVGAALPAHAATLPTSSTPVFFWSGAEYLKGKQSVSGLLAAADVETYARDIFQSASEERLLHPEYVSTENPEVFVSFTFHKVPHNFMAEFAGSFHKGYTFLKDVVTNAPSSLVLTQVSLERKYSSFASMFSVHLAPKAQMIEETVEGSDGCERVVREIGKKKIFNNKRTDLVSVMFTENDQQANEECMKRIISIVSEGTKEKYVCMLSAEAVQPIQVAFPSVSQHTNSAHRSHNRIHTQAVTSSDTIAGTGLIEYITPVIFIGILFALMLLYFFYVGVVAMFSIVVPMRFEKNPFKIGKIY
eukprot:CAMPEP_0114492938 /NCGR_PEP_ID=MMETSP0109-20121206/3837_1 /TAXON_ID=29199 /ORGANISM="Chlorarachnion reptans, Strain CCCM449" /LENGTH=311 /DNA_ID=CAMNT_0001669845 /DNA_START=883 /DNA_END=1818 /DNA_ORIENTATION=-